MPKNTPNLNLYKVDPDTDSNDTFNIDLALNNNWDKIDAAFKEVEDSLDNVSVPNASLDIKGIVQLSNATDGTREDVAATEKAVKTAESNAKTYVDDKPWQKAKLTDDNGDTQYLANADLNTLVKTGVYAVGTATNAPSGVTVNGITLMVYLEVISLSAAGFVMQRLCPTNASGKVPAIYMRMQVNGTWGAWSPDLFQSGVDAKSGVVNAYNALTGGTVSTSNSWEIIIGLLKPPSMYGKATPIPLDNLAGAVSPPLEPIVFEHSSTQASNPIPRGDSMIADRNRDRLIIFGYTAYAIYKLSTGELINKTNSAAVFAVTYDKINGIVYLCSSSSYLVYKISILTGAGIQWTSGSPQLQEVPFRMATAYGELYAVSNTYFFRYGADGALINQVPVTAVFGGPQFAFTGGLAVEPSGNLIVTGRQTVSNSPSIGRINVYGALLKSVSLSMSVNTNYATLCKVDKDGYIYVMMNQRIFKLNPQLSSNLWNTNATETEWFDLDADGNIYTTVFIPAVGGYVRKYKFTSENIWTMLWEGALPDFVGNNGGIVLEVNTSRAANTVSMFINSFAKTGAYGYARQYSQTISLK